MNRPRCVYAVLLFLMTIGCGGTSTTDRFQQMAEARALRNRADKAAKAEESKAGVRKNTTTKKSETVSPVEDKATLAKAVKVTPVKAVMKVAALSNVAPPTSVAPKSMVGKLPLRSEVMQISMGADKVLYAGESKAIGVYDVESKSLIRKIYNPHIDPFSIALSDQGNQVVVGGREGGVKVFSLQSIDGLDRFQRNRVRRKEWAAPGEAHDSVVTALAIHEPSGLVATGDASGLVKVWKQQHGDQPLSPLGEIQSGDTAVVSLSFHRDSGYLLSSSLGGMLSLWKLSSLTTPPVQFSGMDAPLEESSVSPDGRYVATVYRDTDHTVCVWDIEAAESSGGEIKPMLTAHCDLQTTVAAFTSDSRFLLFGGKLGKIRAWSLSEDREIAKFKGHVGSVADIAAMAKPGLFVSVGSDQTIRHWRFPASLPVEGIKIPYGQLADSAKVGEISVPKFATDLTIEDPFDAARQALISGAKTLDVVALMNVSDDIKRKIKSTVASVLESENDKQVSASELSKQRRLLTQSQSLLAPSDDAESLSTFSDGFSNLSFVGATNFKFGLEKRFRPVRLKFSDRFLYAARPSDARPKRKAKDDDLEIDYGDNGALLSWDYKYSRLQAHAWSIEDLRVSDLVSLPDSAGVLTVPQMRIFSQDGSSRPMGDVASWSVSRHPMITNQYLAVGSAGAIRKESDILKIFRTKTLSERQVAPYSQYRSYEGVVTAMAFANNSPYIAFSVRERAVHRLFIADTQTLQLHKLEEVNHSEPWLKGDSAGQVATRNSGAVVGINSLSFSPDDKMLVAHGQYSRELFKFSRWNLSWDGADLASFRKSRKELSREEGPFFDDSGNETIRFISRALREGERDPNDPNWQSKRTAGPSPKIIVRNRKGFHIVNLNSARSERVIPFLSTQHGVPQHTISDDGRWLAMGDDNGKAFVYDMVKGDRYSVAIDSALESMVANSKQARPAIHNRPAHTGPVVGVAFSDPDPGRDYPAYVATVGEENKVKVWELYPILDPSHGLRARHWVDQIKPQARPSKSRRR